MKGHEFNRKARALIAKCYEASKPLESGSVSESDCLFEMGDELMKLEAERRGEKWKEGE